MRPLEKSRIFVEERIERTGGAGIGVAAETQAGKP